MRIANIIAAVAVLISLGSLTVAIVALSKASEVEIANAEDRPIPFDLVRDPVGLQLDETCPNDRTIQSDNESPVAVKFNQSDFRDDRLYATVTWYKEWTDPERTGIYAIGPAGYRDALEFPAGSTTEFPEEGECGMWYRNIGPEQEGDTRRAFFEGLWPEQVYCFGIDVPVNRDASVPSGEKIWWKCVRAPDRF